MVKLKVYAEAFFQVAAEKNKIDQFQKEADFVISTLKSDKDLRDLLVHPEVTETKKYDLFRGLFAQKIDADFLRFFELIISKKREAFILGILEVFIDMVLEHKNMAKAKVMTPIPLSENQQEAIKQRLKTLLQKDIILEIHLEPDLVSGFKIITGGNIIDAGGKKAIENMKNHMRNANYPEKEVADGT